MAHLHDISIKNGLAIEPAGSSAFPRAGATGAAARLIVNADDWGRDISTTDRSLHCSFRGAISSVSSMVFMADSERAASLSREHGIDTGLHLNLTLPFTARRCPRRLFELQQKLCRFLRSNRFAPVLFHPGMVESFRYVVEAQFEEFARLYGAAPARVDGHHHMHLASNVVFQKLIPAGIIVRRNFSFAAGEKGLLNRLYRRWQDRLLAKRFHMADLFFNLAPLDQGRLQHICELARTADIEIETHPANAEEYKFLLEGGLSRICSELRVAQGFRLRSADLGPPKAGPAANDKAEPVFAPVGASVVADPSQVGSQSLPHICVCICTYKRPAPLKRLLTDLSRQNTGGEFTWSIAIADNDEAESAREAVAEMQRNSTIAIKYCVETARGIARARNKVMQNAEGDYVALIDDDEFPSIDWLLTLFRTCRSYDVDGVLGPVRRHFEETPPAWLAKTSLYDRRVNPTGMSVDWHEARTGNVLLRKQVVAGDPAPFRPEFKAGEDQDFFRRKIEEGRRFIWSREAEVYEVIPPARWTRKYYVRKALLQGANAALQPDCGAASILKSLVAVPLYACALPLTLLAGQHLFMTLLVKLCDHAGKLLFLMNIHPIREQYVSE